MIKIKNGMSTAELHDIINNVNAAAEAVNSQPVFNYNTYLMLTPLFKALIISSEAGGKYDLGVNDNKQGFYYEYKELNIIIKVPLSAIFNTNDKIVGILGIGFSTAKDCPSNKRGLCQLPDGELCYAVKGEKQGSKKPANYLLGMGSYLNGVLSGFYWNEFAINSNIRHTFLEYCTHYNINTLRFNLKGDFRHEGDINIIEYLATNNIKLTGYTARDDLYYKLIQLIKHDNIILNGSNIQYTNRFMATEYLLDYLKAQHPCRGGCLKNNCLNCYKLHDALIICLIHGSSSDTQLNNKINREFLTNWFKTVVNLDIKGAWELNLKGLISSLNKYLISNNLFNDLKVDEDLKKYTKEGELKGFKNAVSLCQYIKSKGGY